MTPKQVTDTVAYICSLKTREERRNALSEVDPNFQELVKDIVESYFRFGRKRAKILFDGIKRNKIISDDS